MLYFVIFLYVSHIHIKKITYYNLISNITVGLDEE